MYNSQYNNQGRMGYGAPTTAPTPSPSNLQMDENAAVASLQHLSRADLQQILDNEGKLDDMVNELQQVKDINIEREASLTRNKSLADSNLSLQPKFQQLKQQVATDYEQLNTLKTELAKDIAKLDQYTSQQSLDTLLAVLQTEAAKSEETTEDLAVSFCSKKCEMDDFLEQYIPLRLKAHTKRIKAEKMSEIIRSPPSVNQNNVPSNSSSYNAGGYPGGPAPYPITSRGMPQPYGRY